MIEIKRCDSIRCYTEPVGLKSNVVVMDMRLRNSFCWAKYQSQRDKMKKLTEALCDISQKREYTGFLYSHFSSQMLP